MRERNYAALLQTILHQSSYESSDSGSWESLLDIAENRKEEYYTILRILEISRGRDLGAEFSWIEEYLNTEGSTAGEVAHLLINDKIRCSFCSAACLR
jgi:hypothetical protein